jgi:hypothetical protein
MAAPKTSKKRLAAEEVVTDKNITGLAALKKEFKSGKMPERKLVALKNKLLQVYKSNLHSEEEGELMEAVLIRERARNTITMPDSYALNLIEQDRCEEECEVKIENPPQVHHLVKGLKCKHFFDSDSDRYIVYVPRSVPPEHQMTRDLVLREQRGHFADESEYPKEKILWHRLSLTAKEFNAWFDVVNDSILEKSEQKTEEEYKF